MKSIAVDFNNNMICIMKEEQQGTERATDLKKESFNSFIPEKHRDNSSFTWNFENETFSVNQNYVRPAGCIMTKDCFIPEMIIPMPGLKKRYNEFIAILGYEEVDIKAGIPEELRKLFGLD